MRKMSFLTLVFSLAFIITGCSSGGGDSSTPTSPTTEFQLFPAGVFTVGYSRTVNLTGTDTLGGVYTGTFSAQTQAESTFLGQPAIPGLVQIHLTNTANGATVNNIGTGYYSTSSTDRRYLGYTDATRTTVSAVTSAIPQTAKIGNFGNIGTYTYNTGDVQVQSWRLDDGGNGRAKYVVLSTIKDQFGAVLTSTTTTNLIDAAGNTISFEMIMFLPSDNATITLRGNG